MLLITLQKKIKSRVLPLSSESKSSSLSLHSSSLLDSSIGTSHWPCQQIPRTHFETPGIQESLEN